MTGANTAGSCLSYTSLLRLPLIIVGEFIVQSKHYNNSNMAICASFSHARYAFKF